MSTEAVLLLIVVVGLCAAVPAGYYFLREQKKLIKANEAKQAEFEALAKERQERLTLRAAQQLEEQLQARLDRNHEQIMKLEAEGADREKRLDAQQKRMEEQQRKIEEMAAQLAALRAKNGQLALMVKKLVAQLERHEIKPDLDMDQVNSLLG